MSSREGIEIDSPLYLSDPPSFPLPEETGKELLRVHGWRGEILGGDEVKNLGKDTIPKLATLACLGVDILLRLWVLELCWLPKQV